VATYHACTSCSFETRGFTKKKWPDFGERRVEQQQETNKEREKRQVWVLEEIFQVIFGSL
jgi:hypothetical protein